ncbi:MAG: septum formation initiator family protein [bacterium]
MGVLGGKPKEGGSAWQIVVTVLAIAAIFVSLNFGRELYNNYQVDLEINNLKEKAKSLEAEQLSLASWKEKLESQDFLEAEARMKMGLKKPGENVVIIPEVEKSCRKFRIQAR